MKKNYTTNLVKFLAAILVIFSHSFALALNKSDYLGKFTHNIINFGAFSVSILFAISGFYIMRSIDIKGTRNFIKKRVIRLIPSLFIVVIISIIILGIFFSDISVYNYFKNKNTFLYLLNIIFIPIHDLPGVFNSNIYGSTVNGALWTMMVQFLCYMYIYFYSILKKINKTNKNYYLFISFLLSILGLFIIDYLKIGILKAMIRPFCCFIFGSYLYFCNIKKSFYYVLFLLLFSIICLIIDSPFSLNIFLIFIVSYLVLYLCNNCRINTNNKFIDCLLSCSYELYLVGFPIQQSITNIFGGKMNNYLNFGISLPISIFFALIVKYLSDIIVKKFKI